MSALVRPVCGRANTMLSIFTASTGPSALTGLPVNGDRSWRGAGADVHGVPLGRAGDDRPSRAGDDRPSRRNATTPSTMAAASEADPIMTARRLSIMLYCPPGPVVRRGRPRRSGRVVAARRRGPPRSASPGVSYLFLDRRAAFTLAL